MFNALRSFETSAIFHLSPYLLDVDEVCKHMQSAGSTALRWVPCTGSQLLILSRETVELAASDGKGIAFIRQHLPTARRVGVARSFGIPGRPLF